MLNVCLALPHPYQPPPSTLGPVQVAENGAVPAAAKQQTTLDAHLRSEPGMEALSSSLAGLGVTAGDGGGGGA